MTSVSSDTALEIRRVGFGAITEILLYKDKGLRYIGPLPAEIQNYTSYTASVMGQEVAGTWKIDGNDLCTTSDFPSSRQCWRTTE